MSGNTLAEAHALFAELQGGATETERPIEVVTAPRVSRRFDMDALRAAAVRLGHQSVRDALIKACASTRPDRLAIVAADSILRGEVPGSLTRAAVARYFDDDEAELWPTP